tara:strand:+ start:429 stop:962 length:534 start_codon:yes stop_codon:yes gene_type:complete
MEFENKIILMFITLILDVFIINSLSNKLKPFDFYYAFSILIIHGIFINALFLGSQKVLDVLHYSVFIYIAFSPFLSNKYLIGANLFLVFLIQLLWILKGCCILNDPENPIRFGFGFEISIFTLIYTIILANKLPKFRIKNKKKLKVKKHIRKSKNKSKSKNAITRSIFTTFPQLFGS